MVHGNRYNPFHCKQIRKNSTYTNRQKRQPRYMGFHLQHIDIKSFKIIYLATVKLGLECFAVAEHRISRDRELVADQEGVTASDRDSMTSALVKVHAFARYWQPLETAIAEALRQGNMYAN